MENNKILFKCALSVLPILTLGILIAIYKRTGGESFFWSVLFAVPLISLIFYYGRIFKRLYFKNKMGHKYVLTMLINYFVVVSGILSTFFFFSENKLILIFILFFCVYQASRFTENIYNNNELKEIVDEELKKMR